MKRKKYDPRAVILTERGVCMIRAGGSHYYALTRASRVRLMNTLHRKHWLGMPSLHDGFVHFKQSWVCEDINAYLYRLDAV